VLPLVASYGKGAVVFFDRETGAREDGRVDDTGIATEPIERLYFSPDGKSLLAQTTDRGLVEQRHDFLKFPNVVRQSRRHRRVVGQFEIKVFAGVAPHSGQRAGVARRS
jgi:hypothetical protein